MHRTKTPVTELTPVKNVGVHAIACLKPFRRRQLQADKVDALVASIRENGLLQPITIRPNPGAGFWLVAGRHRLEAAKKLGWKHIPAIIHKSMDDDHAILTEIDENLARAELSPAECAGATAKRKEVYERLHPQTKHGGDRKSRSSRKVGNLNDRFTKDIAERTA
jgi:ParB/RepB/Spo0J family partition protein